MKSSQKPMRSWHRHEAPKKKTKLLRINTYKYMKRHAKRGDIESRLDAFFGSVGYRDAFQ